MTNNLILITGGQRSGKSDYAQRLALSLSPQPVYLATSRIWDEEHRRRIEHHQAGRGPEWTTVEEEKDPARYDWSGRVVLLDCVTLWATNYFFDLQGDPDRSLAALINAFDRLVAQEEARFILVTNEIGMGEMSQNKLQREFAGLQGRLNQYIAARAGEVVLMVSGIPLKIK
jgi:adenosylcobinamide kinase/adenosylcobinamide-phosphate guanylyltransferase